MKKSFLILIMIFSNFSFSQTNSIRLKYNLNLDKLYEHSEKDVNNKNYKINKLIAETASEMELSLFIKNDKAIFKEESKMSIGNMLNDNLKIMVRAFSFKGDYLTDLNNKYQISIKEIDGKSIYVKNELNKKNWTLTKETKKILGYTCFKATYIKEIPKGEFEVSAWYAPGLSFQFGPTTHFGELPGLILELNDVAASYSAVEIELNPKVKTKILWPKEEEIITEENYKSKSDEIGKTTRN